MATNTPSTPSTKAGDLSATPAANAGETERTFDVSGAQGAIADLSRRLERMLQEGIESLRSHSRTYVDSAGQQVGAARRSPPTIPRWSPRPSNWRANTRCWPSARPWARASTPSAIPRSSPRS